MGKVVHFFVAVECSIMLDYILSLQYIQNWFLGKRELFFGKALSIFLKTEKQRGCKGRKENGYDQND